METCTRFRSIAVRFTPLAAVVLGLLAAIAPAAAYFAPNIPTYAFQWGTPGSAPGQLDQPEGIAAARDGYLYVADRNNNRIQKFDGRGNLPRQLASFSGLTRPTAITTDTQENLYVLEDRPYSGSPAPFLVRKFAPTGTLIGTLSLSGMPSDQSVSDLAVGPDGALYVAHSTMLAKFNSAGGTLTAQLGVNTASVAIDSRGVLYVLTGFNVLMVQSSDLTVLGSWGTIGFGDGQFILPSRLALDALGNVYVVDPGADRVQKFTRNGEFICKWATDANGNGAFGIAVSPNGDVYVGDPVLNRIQKFSSTGSPAAYGIPFHWAQWGTPGSGPLNFNQPAAIASRKTLFYVADAGNNRISMSYAAANGQIGLVGTWGSTGTGINQFQNPSGVAADSLDNVFVLDTDNHRVQKFGAFGSYTTQWGTLGSGPGQFQFPAGIACDAAGNVYVADAGNSRIQKFTNVGAFITSWGSPGNGPGQFSLPSAVAVHPNGLVYVLDRGNCRVQWFSSTGAYIGQWGSAGSGDGQFSLPKGIAVDRYGHVFVSDTSNQRVQMFTSNGTWLAGFNSLAGGLGQLNGPAGLCTDPGGNVYVADAGNGRIVEYGQPARVLMVEDVPHDQGGQVRVRFERSTIDTVGPVNGLVSYYAVFHRGVDGPWNPGPALAFATGDAQYSVVIANPSADATPTSNGYSQFQAQTALGNGVTTWDGGAIGGMSIDNLSPPPPTAFVANASAGSTQLSWSATPPADFAAFRLYRGTTTSFIPTTANLLVETTATSWVDPAGSGFYKLSAMDRNGNESEIVTASAGVAGTGDGEPVAFALRGTLQNPVRGDRLDVAFSLAREGVARLEMFDVSGRRVADRDLGRLEAGAHTARISGATRIATGIYHLRLSQNGETRSVRVAVID